MNRLSPGYWQYGRQHAEQPVAILALNIRMESRVPRNRPVQPTASPLQRAARAGDRTSAFRARLNGSVWLPLLPALSLIAILFGTSGVNGVAQSVGYLPYLDQRTISLDAYRSVLTGPIYAQEFWISLIFSLWVSAASTLLSIACALLIVGLGGRRLRAGSRSLRTVLNINLAFPHLVWALGLALVLAQSGLLARIAAALGWIDTPADFPILVRDRFGLGIILHYVTKETPFLLLIALGILQSQPEGYDIVAQNLGADRWQRLRYVTLPLLLPGLLGGGLLVFAFVFGAYEVPALLGVRYPQMVSVLALDFFLNPDLRSRAEGMAISVLMALVVLLVALGARRSAVNNDQV